MDVIFATLIFSVAISYVTFTHSGSTQAISSTIGNLLTSILIAAGIGTLAGLAGRLTKSYH